MDLAIPQIVATHAFGQPCGCGGPWVAATPGRRSCAFPAPLRRLPGDALHRDVCHASAEQLARALPVQALRAADRAVQLGQSHNQVLSRQVRALEEQLSQQGGSGAYPGQDPEIQRLRDELLIAQWEAGQAQQPRYGAEEDAAAARIQAAYRDAQRRRQQELDSERFRAYR